MTTLLKLSLPIVLLIATSCQSPSRRMPASTPLPPATFAGTSGAMVLPERWWEVFQDPALNALIDQALTGNLTLQSAWYRLDQAAAIAHRERADLFPSVDGSTRASRRETRSRGGSWHGSDTYSLGLAASYEVDLWGRVRAGNRAQDADTQVAAYDLQAAALSLTGRVAEIWYRLVLLHAQLEVIDDQLETNATYLDVITGSFQRGRVGAADVLQQRQLLEDTRSTRILVESTISLLEHQLAVLVGQPPGTLPLPTIPRPPPLPALPAAGLPMEWVQRRPDLLSSWALVEAAGWRTGAAIADRYPRLSLTVNVETSAEKVRDLLDNWLANLAANLVGPIIDAGERKAEIARTEAVLRQAVTNYGSDLLAALSEVADGLALVRDQQRFLESLDRQLELARQASDQVRETYIKGSGDFTRYLTSLTSQQRLSRSRLTAYSDLLQEYIGLARALGGTWQPPRPDSLPLTFTSAEPSYPDAPPHD